MNIYSPLHPAAFFMIQRRQRLIRKIFAESFPENMKDVSLLEIGCGGGQWLAEFQAFGLRAANMSGIEIDESRAESAKQRIESADIRVGNAAELPWEDNSFDIVFQSTVFTSVLDEDTRFKIASEMKRVCKDSGFILWYDFVYNNPRNPNVRGVSKKEVKKLFAPHQCEFQSVTLAPPLARAIAPVSSLAADFAEACFPFFRTHLIAKITSGS